MVITTGWAVLLSLVFVLVFLGAGDLLVRVLTDLPEVRAEAIRYLPWVAVMPLVAVWSYLLDGLFIGASRALAMRNAMLLALACYLPLTWALRGQGNHYLWAGFLTFMALRSVFLGGWFGWLWRTGRWMKRV